MISIPPYALDVVTRLEDHGFEAYVVGGCVRDSLMGRHPADWDVCTAATPEEVLRVFKRFHVIKTGLKHGTVTVRSRHQNVEVTTFRLDGGYSDNRHPDAVTFVSRVEEDLARRDFTINAMAYSPTRGLVDAFGGQADLAAGVIRCVGEPDERFHEDGLRILRALRFAARFGFELERETAASIRRNRHLLGNISAERLFKELKGILCGAGVREILLGFPEVFSEFMPQLAPMVGFEQHNPYHLYDVWGHSARAVEAVPPDERLRLTMLLHDAGKPQTYSLGEDGVGHFYGHPAVSERLARELLLALKSDNATMDEVSTLIRYHDANLPTTKPGMRRFVGKLGEERMPRLFEVKAADMAAQSAHNRPQRRAALRAARELFEEVCAEQRAFTVKDLSLNGRDLMQMGMQPGPAIRRVLETLLAEVQDEQLANEASALRARAEKLMPSAE